MKTREEQREERRQYENDVQARIKAAIPETLARLARAAMAWWKSDGFEYVNQSQKLRLACAAHAAWKAKQRRKGK